MSTNNDNTSAPEGERAWYNSLAWRKWGGFMAVVLLVAFIFREPVATFIGYRAAMDEMNAGAQFFRDFVALFVVVIGIAMAAWRNASLDRQSRATNKQADLANARLYSDEFANAVELMSRENKDGKPAIAARIGGIYIMADLATKLPAEFAERVAKNLIAYIKDNARRKTIPPGGLRMPAITMRTIGGDVKAAFSVLSDILGNEKIKEHVADRFLDFSEHNFSELDFRGIDLSHYTKWTETNFTECDLSGVHFADGADMYGAIFSGATLQMAILQSVDLHGADLRGANLRCVNMQGADLTEANMQGCRMCLAQLHQTDEGKNTIMKQTQLVGANLDSADLSGAYMNRANLRGAMLAGADLTDAKEIIRAEFGETCIEDCKINQWEKGQLSELENSAGRKIWIDKHSLNTNWRLKEYKDGYALAGVLMNFADAPSIDNADLMSRAWSLRVHPQLRGEPENIWQQAAKIEKVPENTPDSIKEWLKEIRERYSGQ